MAKEIYIGGTDSIARKVKPSYIGVDSVARKVKKGYVGKDSVARQFLDSKSISNLFDVAWRKYFAIQTNGVYGPDFSSYLGFVFTDDGVYPEAGINVQGTPFDDTCVLKIGDDYYYYIRSQELTQWDKYNCIAPGTKIYSELGPSNETSSFQIVIPYNSSSHSFYKNYFFSTTNGYYGSNKISIPTVTSSTDISSLNLSSLLEGYYYVSKDRVWKIISYTGGFHQTGDYANVGLNITTTSRTVARASSVTVADNTYVRGSSLYGTLITDRDELPLEEGTQILGSLEENYCVRQVGNVNYYYIPRGISSVYTVWNKYGCMVETRYQREADGSEYQLTNNMGDYGNAGYKGKSSYTFSESSGFSETGTSKYITVTSTSTAAELSDQISGTYERLSPTRMICYTGVTEVIHNYSSSYDWYVKYKGYYLNATEYVAGYTRDSTYYGEKIVRSGQLPEEGTLIAGSANEEYCIIQINGVNYYYSKLGAESYNPLMNYNAIWNKYNTVANPVYTYEDYAQSGMNEVLGIINYFYDNGSTLNSDCYSSYNFNSSTGTYSLSGRIQYPIVTANTTASEIQSVLVGSYLYHSSNSLRQVTRVTVTKNSVSGSNYTTQFEVKIYAKIIRSSSQTISGYTYDKGSTLQGYFITEGDEFPEQGTKIEGSSYNNYYVLKVGGTHYYYEKNLTQSEE